MESYYKIFQNEEKEVIAVKQGWSWPAFFLSVFWAAYKQLLQHALFGFVVIVGAAYIKRKVFMPGLFSFCLSLVPLVVPILFGFLGNGWYGGHLKMFGFRPLVLVRADSPKQAIDLWQKKYVEGAKDEGEDVS